MATPIEANNFPLPEAVGIVVGALQEKYDLGDERAADLLDWYEPGQFPLPDGGIGEMTIKGRLFDHDGMGKPCATVRIEGIRKKPVSIAFDAGRNALGFKSGKNRWDYSADTPAPKFVKNTLKAIGATGILG